MPQLCPVSEDVPEANVYNNPPILTKKPEGENVEKISESQDEKDVQQSEEKSSSEKCDETIESENLSTSPTEKPENNSQVNKYVYLKMYLIKTNGFINNSVSFPDKQDIY